MVKPLISLYPRAMSSASEEETPRPIPMRRAALIQTCEDGVERLVSQQNTLTPGKTPG